MTPPHAWLRGRDPPAWTRPGIVLVAVAAGYQAPLHPFVATATLTGVVLVTVSHLRSPARWTATVGLLLVAGAALHARPHSASPPFPLDEPLRLGGRVAADPRTTDGGVSVLVDVDRLAPDGPGPWRPFRGRVALSIRTGTRRPDLARDDGIVFRARLHPPEGRRNPGTESYRAYLARRRVGARASAPWPGRVSRDPTAGPPSALLVWRRGLARHIDDAVPPTAAGVLRALTLGDRSALSPPIRRLFRQAGTAHLLAISGLHLGVLALLLVSAIRWGLRWTPTLVLRIPAPPLAHLASLPALALYAGFSGFQTSTLRALAMVGLLVGSRGFSRPMSPLTLLTSTVLLLALGDPGVLGDPALHLSVAALVGLFWLAPLLTPSPPAPPDPIDKLLPPVPVSRARGAVDTLFGGGRRLAITSLAASLATLPVAIYHFGSGSVAGLAANLVAVPALALWALPLGLGGLIFAGALPRTAAGLWKLAALPVPPLIELQRFVVEHIPPVGGSGPGAAWAALGLVLVLAGGLAWLRRPGSRKRATATVIAGVLLATVPPVVRVGIQHVDPRVHLWALDVGHGLAVAVGFPGNRWCLVDGGGVPGSRFDMGARVVVPALEALGAGGLDRVISTHPHPDHLGGLPSSIRWGRPREVWIPESFRGDPRYGPLLEAAREVGARVSWVPADGTSAPVADATMIASWAGGPTENDRSLVVAIELGSDRIVIGGDVERGAQKRFVAAHRETRARYVVAPHHGAADAVFPPWFEALRPEEIWVSENRTRVPSPALLRTAEALGSTVRTTAREGALHGWLENRPPR